jgi:hypothetical protein
MTHVSSVQRPRLLITSYRILGSELEVLNIDKNKIMNFIILGFFQDQA